MHKTASIFDKMPRSVQPRPKTRIHDMCMSDTKANAFRPSTAPFSGNGARSYPAERLSHEKIHAPANVIAKPDGKYQIHETSVN